MKLLRKQKLGIKPKTIAIVTGSIFLLVAIFTTLFFNLKNNTKSFGAVNGEYRSITSGNWNATSTWQKYNGSSWIAAVAVPSNTDAAITIQSGHTVTVTANTTVDQVVVSSGGTLSINSGVTLTLANGSGNDLDVVGVFKNAGTLTISASAVVNIQAAGRYQHNFTTTAGTIPTATWASGSTCEIIGYTTNTSAPAGLQSFSNFIWNCPSQSGQINLNGGLTTVNSNLTITSTGSASGKLYLANATSTLNVGGSFTQTGGYFSLSGSSSSTSTMTVTGTYTQSGGTFSVVDGSGANGVVNIMSNYSHTGGTLTVGGNSSTNASFNFKKAGTQTFTASSNTVTGNVDYTVFSGSILSLGTNIVSGRNFTVNSGGGLMIGSLGGISASGATGNIQVSTTRTFNTGADYTYNGASSQVLGSGLPATVRNLTINDGANLTLGQSTTVSGTLTLTSGKITTGVYELYVSNSSTGAISGSSSTSYVIGNLRRAVGASGAYNFPLGTSTNYEQALLTLSGSSGPSNVLGTFVNTNPNDTVNPLDGITVSGVDMQELLDYGYWTLTPNSPMVAGSYTVQLKEKGYSNVVGLGTLYCVLYRSSTALPWLSSGTHSDATQSLSGGIVTAARSTYASFGQYAIALGDFIAFDNPTLYSGTDGEIGAVYIFPNVMRMIDAWVEITDIQGGATLNTIDDQSTGYDESFQPFINYPPDTTAYFQWKITFKKAGTSTDTTLKKMNATGVDVDGGTSGAKAIQEFIDATMPSSYALDPLTTLTVTNMGGHYRAMGSTATISNIDTSQKQAMYELSYNNVNSIMYRTGAVSTYTTTQTRQTSLYFRSFNLTVRNIALPIKLINFDAILRQNKVRLNWSTATETNNNYFTVERSGDGEHFEKVTTQRGAGNSSTTRTYEAVDEFPLPGYSFYRLKQTDFDGHYTYSDVKTVSNKSKSSDQLESEIKSVSPNPFTDRIEINFVSIKSGTGDILILNPGGQLISSQTIQITEGYNHITVEDLAGLPEGIYFVGISIGEKCTVKKIIKSN